MRLVLAVPVLAIVVAAYLILGAGGGLMLDADAFSANMPSGAVFTLTGGDFFTIAGLAALFLEILKAARAGAGSVLDHTLSTGTFIVALVCFLLVDYCGTVSFFLLTAMSLIDVIAGFSVSILAARRDLTVSQSLDGGL